MKSTSTILCLACILIASCTKETKQNVTDSACNEKAEELAQLGFEQLQQKQTDSALFFLKQAEALDSMCFYVNHQLSTAYSMKKEYHKALAVNNRMIAQVPDMPDALMKSAIFSHFIGELDQEQHYLQEASEAYVRLDCKELYPGDLDVNSAVYAFDVELCDALGGDTTASQRINKLLDGPLDGYFNREVFYNLTPEKYYTYLQHSAELGAPHQNAIGYIDSDDNLK